MLLCGAALHSAEPALTTLTYSGEQSALEAIDADLKAAGNDAAKLGALETQLLGILRKPGTTFAARQAAAQRLGLVLAQGTPKSAAADYKPLATMLVDERESDLARLALEPAPGAVIDGMFVSALAKTTGRVRLGILDSILRRRSATAVPALARLLKDADAATAAAAARALAEIATPEAITALRGVPEPSARAIAAAKITAAGRIAPEAALPLLRELEKSAADPALRTAAFRSSLDLEPAAAPGRISEALAGSDWTLKQVALEAIGASKAPELVAALTDKISNWDAPTRAAVIAALGRRHEAAGTEIAAKAVSDAEAEVRTAAISALGMLPGNRSTVTLLAKTAAAADGEQSKLARESLAQLNGPDVNAAIVAGAQQGEAVVRAVYLEQLALRNQSEGLSLLLSARKDADPAVRLAAVGALGEIARPGDVPALIEWTTSATDDAEQARALRALVTTIQRVPAKQRGSELFTAIDQAPPATALRLLPALQRIGGTPEAECVARAAQRGDTKLADAAVATLSRWSDNTALNSLATVAEKSSGKTRAAAIDAILRYFEKNRESWKPAATTLLAKITAITTDDAADASVRKRVLAILNRANESSALALVEKFQTDAKLAGTARETAEVVQSNIAGRPKLSASGSEGQLASILDGKTSTRWSVPAEGDEWVEIEFRRSRPLRRITLDQTGRDAEFPEHYEVYVMEDRTQRGAPIASGQGKRGRTVVELPPGTRGRIVLIKNTAERKDAPWAICELWVD